MLNTDQNIKSAIGKHIDKIHQIGQKATDSCECFRLLEDVNKEFADSIAALAKDDPVVYPFDVFGDEDVFPTIEQRAANRQTLARIPISYFYDVIQGEKVYTPAYVEWQTKENKKKNFVLTYDNDEFKEKSINTINQIVLSIILAFPIKKVHISILDLEMADDMEYLTRNIDEKLISNIIDDQGVSELTGHLTNDYFRHSNKLESIYELVIVPDATSKAFNYIQKELYKFFINGNKYGVHFILLNDTTKPIDRNGSEKHLLDCTEVYQRIDVNSINDFTCQEGALTRTFSFANDQKWSKMAIDYIKENVTKKISYSKDWKALSKENPIDLYSTISVPIGVGTDGEVQNFVLDCEQHTDVFVLGKSGYGKSVLLHNILYNMVLTYSPSDLQLYLLDFKQGGPEFYPYKNVPHVRALMVDGNDKQVTYAILEKIYKDMEVRGKEISKANVGGKIEEYNRKYPNQRLPQIVLVVDECHHLFDEYETGDKVLEKYITTIAKEGRNQGVHFIFATQTLSGLDIPNGVKRIISDHYLLNCDDNTSDQMVSGSYTITQRLEKGQVFFHNGNTRKEFQAYYTAGEEKLRKETLSLAQEKYSNIKLEEPQFYFSGSIKKYIDMKVIERLPSDNCSMAWGYELSLKQDIIISEFLKSSNQNTFICGINDKLQAVGTTMAGVVSFAIKNKRDWLGYDIFILNNYVSSKYKRLELFLDHLEKIGLCENVSIKESGNLLLNMCNNITSDNSKETLLVILGFNDFSNLKKDAKLPIPQQLDTNKAQQQEDTLKVEVEEIDPNVPNIYKDTEADNVSFDDPREDEWKSSPEYNATKSEYQRKMENKVESDEINNLRTYQDAMRYILMEGSQKGVYTVIQTDIPKDLFLGTGKLNMDMFGYQIFHKMEESEIKYSDLDNSKYHFDKLSDKPDRLRAYYHSNDQKEYSLMIPIAMPDIDNIDEMLNQ